MPIVLYFIFSLAAIVITLKVMVGYNKEFSTKLKSLIAFLIVFAWFSPVVFFCIRQYANLSETANLVLMQCFYTVFVTAFFLLCLILIRDTFWVYGFAIAKKLKKASDKFDPMNPLILKKSNIWTVVLSICLSGYALYEGHKFPEIKQTDIYTAKLSKPFNIVALSDIHITPLTKISFLERLVSTVNDLKPDAIVLVGDIADSSTKTLEKQMAVLKNLKAKQGVFVTLGNHEFYAGSLDWEKKFKEMGFAYLANTGKKIADENIYISGLPDPQMLKVNKQATALIEMILKEGGAENYKVFLSHSPKFVKNLNNELIDLQISGHTHGGQIFPLHYVINNFNDFLAGLYDVNDVKLYVTRGVSTWGPRMRLFAPSEISVINLLPEKK